MNNFNENAFYQTLRSSQTFEECISIVEAYVDHMHKIALLETVVAAMCKNFHLSCDDIARIAKVLRKGVGKYGVDCLHSLRSGKVMPLIDAITLEHVRTAPLVENQKYSKCFDSLIKALRKVGFRAYLDFVRAPPKLRRFRPYYNLWNEFYRIIVERYGKVPTQMKIKYPYKQLCNLKADLHESLAMYFYHPSRVEKWILENPDKELEEYMT